MAERSGSSVAWLQRLWKRTAEEAAARASQGGSSPENKAKQWARKAQELTGQQPPQFVVRAKVLAAVYDKKLSEIKKEKGITESTIADQAEAALLALREIDPVAARPFDQINTDTLKNWSEDDLETLKELAWKEAGREDLLTYEAQLRALEDARSG